MGVELLHIIGPIFAQGQPSRIVATVDPTCPSPFILRTADETWNYRFGFVDVLVGSNKDWFPKGVLKGVNPKFGVNLSRMFHTSLRKASFIKDNYLETLNVSSRF
jgi:hypothetical protein